MHKYNRQQGGTLFGIIVGLVIGLGIALAVAMVITKTPMPFMDKSGRVKAAEPTASQSTDPNKPMYGNKNAARDAAKDFAREPAPPQNTATPQPDKKAEIKVDPKQDAIAAKVSALESSDKAKKADAEATDDKWSYYLQAGAFREPNDAESTRAKLALMGVEAKISERQSESGVLFRVRVGPFGQLDAMNKVRGKLSDNGVDAAVVRIAK
jgi:cell division protein FtsN